MFLPFFLTSLQGETLQSKIIDKNLKKVNRISHDYAFYFLYYIRKLFKIHSFYKIDHAFLFFLETKFFF